MKGVVKWFSDEKGYGFIYGEDELDRYFNVKDVQGSVLPKNGDKVEFQSLESKKGLRASNVSITQRNTASTQKVIKEHHVHKNRDDRVKCHNCGRKMVPRVLTTNTGRRLFSNGRYPEVDSTVCPFCGATYMSNRGCFITTAACQHFNLPDNCVELETLRHFRDSYLLTFEQGRELVKDYYVIAPSIVNNLKNEADYNFIWQNIQSCIDLIKKEEFDQAVNIYNKMVTELKYRIV